MTQSYGVVVFGTPCTRHHHIKQDGDKRAQTRVIQKTGSAAKSISSAVSTTILKIDKREKKKKKNAVESS